MDSNILNLIFQHRVDDISKITEADINYLNTHLATSVHIEDIKKYILFSEVIDRNSLISTIEDYLSYLHFETGYYCEKYYKHGFADAINLCNECKELNIS